MNSIPIFIPLYNNVTYAKSMVQQLIPYDNNITLIDNNSDYPPLLEYYKECQSHGSAHVIRQNKNVGPQVSLMKMFKRLPNIFIYTDPDLLLNKNIPSDFIRKMVDLTEKYKVYKVGFALELDLSKFKDTSRDLIQARQTILWSAPIKDDTYELYGADIDTTFAIYNKRYYTGNFFGPSIRVAGNFTCEHIPWYKDPAVKIDKEELEYYMKNNKFIHWT